MKFPSVNDFLEEFGIEPVEVDPNLALCRYVQKSRSGGLEIDVSYSAVMESFQVVLRLANQEVANISSENVKLIELVRDSAGAGVRVIFDIFETKSEARITFDPEISCRWWILRNT